MTRLILAIPLAVAACAEDGGPTVGSDAYGHPVVYAPGYVMTVCETGVGLGGNMKKAMVSAYVRWGCGKGK